MQLSEYDQSQWTENPEEFTRNLYWEPLTIPSLSLAAKAFLKATVSSELGESTQYNMARILDYVVQYLSNSNSNVRMVDALLIGIGTIADELE